MVNVLVTTTDLLQFVWSFIRKQRVAFFFITLVSFVWSLDATVWPYIFRLIIDGFTAHETERDAAWAAIQTPVLCGLGLWIMIELGFRCQGFILSKAFPRLEADIRMHMFNYIQYHSPKYFNEHFAGSLSNKISDMTTHVTLVLQNLLTIFVPALAIAIIAISFFANMQPLFAALLAIWITTHISISVATAKKCDALEHDHSMARSELVGTMVDSLQNNFAVNLFYRFRNELQRITAQSNREKEKHVRARRAVEKTRVILGLVSFFLSGLGINGLMIYFWIQGELTTGEAAQIFNTTWNVTMVMWMAGMAIPSFFQSMGLLKQALTLMHDPQDILDAAHASELRVTKGEIVFENVWFQYGEQQLFSNKSIRIPGGQKVGLVGYSGAGKSTFVNLILRLYPVKTGKILIDGQDIQTITLESLRKQVSLIPQDPILFHRSLEDNIGFGKEEASFDEILNASHKAHVHEFVSQMSAGYKSVVGERGTKLSGGQRQRIAIARAVIAEAPILILDEATSSLDSVTEKYIQDSLETLMAGKTVIAVAHRLSTLAKMDRILVFDKGKIIEDGTHEELLAKSSHYAHMWHMQAGGFIPDTPL